MIRASKARDFEAVWPLLSEELQGAFALPDAPTFREAPVDALGTFVEGETPVKRYLRACAANDRIQPATFAKAAADSSDLPWKRSK